MEVFNNIIAPNHHRSRNDATALSGGSTAIRGKFPHRRKRSKRLKKTETLGLGATEDSFPYMERVQADDCCVVCANDVEYVYALNKCGHRACLDCWRNFSLSQVSSYALGFITCVACDNQLPQPLVLQLIKPPTSGLASHSGEGSSPTLSGEKQAAAEKLYRRYDDYLLRQYLLHDKHIRLCPRGCGYAVSASHGLRDCPRIECGTKGCGAFCYKCRGVWESSNGGEHVCRQSSKPSNVANAATGGGAVASDKNFGLPTDKNHETPLLLRFQQLFRLPTATAAPKSPDTNPDVQKLVAEPRGDLEEGSPDYLPRSSSERILLTAQSRNDDDNEDDISVRKVSNAAGVSNVEMGLDDEVKPCPRCKTLVQKMDDGSCNHMTCLICGCEFCWLCLREIRDTHYLSPTGCTFWGRARWPFRRRVCAMLLAAFGTPFILAIATAVAIPGIIFGFPAYLVYKVGKSVDGNKKKRIFLQILSFFGGLLSSPIIAALVALFGVPLVLIYVYIFMPITLFSELKVRLTESTGTTENGKAGERPDVVPNDSEVHLRKSQGLESGVEPPIVAVAADDSSLPASLQTSSSSSATSNDSFKTASSSLPMDYQKPPRPRVPRSRSMADSLKLVNEKDQ